MEDRAGWFALFVFLVSRDCCVALFHDATGLSAVCDRGIYWLNSLTIFETYYLQPLLLSMVTETIGSGFHLVSGILLVPLGKSDLEWRILVRWNRQIPENITISTRQATSNRGSYFSAHVLLNLLNELRKSDEMRGLTSILSLFRNELNEFNITGARMLDYIITWQ